MASDVNLQFQQLQKRIDELEQRCIRHREAITKLHLFHQQLHLRVNILEQLVYQDYLYLRELYRERLSREEQHKQYLI